MTAKIRLNIGAGDSTIPGFTSIDIKTGTDITKPLPYKDGEVDEVYCSHCLEHIHHSKAYHVMLDMVRVLKPGGRIRIAVPRFESILERIRTGEMDMGLANAWLYGSRDDPTDRHQFMPTEFGMETTLRQLGIEQIGTWDAEYDDCSKLPDSLNIGGYKRLVRINPKPKVVLALSTSRFGPTDFYHCVTAACSEFGWKLFPWGGDNWAKALTQVIDSAIKAENPDYIITLDFDSAFHAGEMPKLVEFMQDHPEIGAAFPVQAHRHQDTPLGLSPTASATGYYDFSKNNPWGGVFTPYGSGHFGCTIIRRQVFDMPRPWFRGLPTTLADGTIDWDKDSLDNDISFWVAMTGHGWKFGQLNTVQIGHMELAVKWIAGDRVIWQPIQHFRKNGRPPQAVFDGEAWNAKMRKAYGVEAPTPSKDEPETSVPSRPGAVIADYGVAAPASSRIDMPNYENGKVVMV